MTADRRAALVERVALAICEDAGMVHQCKEACAICKVDATAAIDLIRNEVLEEAAKVAEGPAYRTSSNGEISIRGKDKSNWSVPMPISGFRGSDYGTGRYDAAAAIRALKERQ